MKQRKTLNKQMDFLSDNSDSIQSSQLASATRETEALLSQLLLSTLCQNEHPIKEERHVQN